MDVLDLETFEARSAAFDAAVLATPDIDHFCSSTPWILPASEAMMPSREPWLRACDAGYVALMRADHLSLGRYLQPLEASWCFACGLAGADPRRLARAFAADCRARRREWDALLLSGIKLNSALYRSLFLAFRPAYRVFHGMVTRRFSASLEGGVDGFLSRRSANFRKGLKKSRRRGRELGLSIEPCPAPPLAGCPALYERLIAVERRSWKGLSQAGIDQGRMYDFYRLMLPRLVARGLLRLRFARLGDEDVGFILGAVWSGVYRGLQFSFDDRFRDAGLGNLLQMSQIEALVEEGVSLYDLGSEAPYKERWAERGLDTIVMVIRR